MLDDSWSSPGCGCTVYRIPAYGIHDRVRLKRGKATAQCSKTSTISSRICACKPGAAVGDECDKDVECSKGYCNSGKCAALIGTGKTCSTHSSCSTSYCDPKKKVC